MWSSLSSPHATYSTKDSHLPPPAARLKWGFFYRPLLAYKRPLFVFSVECRTGVHVCGAAPARLLKCTAGIVTVVHFFFPPSLEWHDWSGSAPPGNLGQLPVQSDCGIGRKASLLGHRRRDVQTEHSGKLFLFCFFMDFILKFDCLRVEGFFFFFKFEFGFCAILSM